MWHLQKSSQIKEEVYSLFGTQFKTAVDTRWYTKFDAIKDFLNKKAKFPDQINTLFDNHQKPVKTTSGTRAELSKLTEEELSFF